MQGHSPGIFLKILFICPFAIVSVNFMTYLGPLDMPQFVDCFEWSSVRIPGYICAVFWSFLQHRGIVKWDLWSVSL